MKLNYLKDKRKFTTALLLGLAAVLAVAILVNITSFFVTSAKAGNLVKKAVEQTELDKDKMDKYFEESRELANKLKKNNLFAPPPPKQLPIKRVLGILGNEVLIEGKWYKLGDMVKDAKIVAIEPAQVKIEWDGKKITLEPISAASSSPPGTPTSARVVTGQAESQGVPVAPEPMRRGRRGGRSRGGFGNLSPEERAAMRERFRNASDEERQQMRNEMRRRFREGQ